MKITEKRLDLSEKRYQVMIKPKPMCNHCSLVMLVRKYGQCDGRKIWWLECPACKRRY